VFWSRSSRATLGSDWLAVVVEPIGPGDELARLPLRLRAGATRCRLRAHTRIGALAVWSALQAVLNGLLTGGLFAIIGMGMALIFGVMRIVNFAHGAFLMFGMYVTFVLFDRLGVNPYFGFVGAGVLLFGVGYATYELLLRWVAERSHFMQILLTLGISLIIIDGVQLWSGAEHRKVNLPMLTVNVHLGSHISLNVPELLSFAITVVLAIGMFLIVMKSRPGRALRAIAQNRYAASLMGINVRRTEALSFGLGMAAVGVAGGLLLPQLFLHPDVGGPYTLKSFVMVVLGGMGSIVGAGIAGLVLGVIESLTSLYWGQQWALAVDFVIFLLVLSLRPAGLFGSQRA
jgi:branched-chain amino acid transport system permease protein